MTAYDVGTHVGRVLFFLATLGGGAALLMRGRRTGRRVLLVGGALLVALGLFAAAGVVVRTAQESDDLRPPQEFKGLSREDRTVDSRLPTYLYGTQLDGYLAMVSNKANDDPARTAQAFLDRQVAQRGSEVTARAGTGAKQCMLMVKASTPPIAICALATRTTFLAVSDTRSPSAAAALAVAVELEQASKDG